MAAPASNMARFSATRGKLPLYPGKIIVQFFWYSWTGGSHTEIVGGGAGRAGGGGNYLQDAYIQ